MKRLPYIAAAALACAGIALSAGGWTQTATAEWFKGIIYAGSGRVQLTNAAGQLIAPLQLAGLPTGQAASVIGVTGSAGYHVDIPSSSDGQVLRRSGSTLGFGTVGTTGIADNAITLAKLPTGTSAMSVLGVTGATGLNYTPISAAADGNVLRRSGSTLGFGTINVADATNVVTGVLGFGNGGTNASTAASGFANLSPQTSKGDLIVYSTAPLRLPTGASGQTLVVENSTASGLAWSYERAGIPGSTGACTGCVGELISITATGTVNLTSGAACNVGATTCPATGGTQSITLTAGDWLISSMVAFTTAASTSFTYLTIAVTDVSNSFPASVLAAPSGCEAQVQVMYGAVVPGSGQNVLIIPAYACRVANGATKTLYPIAQAGFTVSTMSVNGWIEARRIR